MPEPPSHHLHPVPQLAPRGASELGGWVGSRARVACGLSEALEREERATRLTRRGLDVHTPSREVVGLRTSRTYACGRHDHLQTLQDLEGRRGYSEGEYVLVRVDRSFSM